MNPLRSTLLRASQSQILRRQLTAHELPRSIVRRFVPGETLEEGLAAAAALARDGKSVTLDHLGESVTDEAEARAAADAYLRVIDRLAASPHLDGGVSVKPTQMGLAISEELCQELLGAICAAAGAAGAHVTLDMEGSDVTEATVVMVERLRADGHDDVGCAVQSYLHRTFDDVRRLSAAGASLRLCKGAYAEPAEIAYQDARAVSRSYARCADWLLRHGRYPRMATHDGALVDHIRTTAVREGHARDGFEFQMLYGVRSALQDALVRDGWRVRVYVPFGDQWYPYFMRRLAERPANVVFLLRALRGG